MSRVQHRLETLCYGPKSCTSYRAGPVRKFLEDSVFFDEVLDAPRDSVRTRTGGAAEALSNGRESTDAA